MGCVCIYSFPHRQLSESRICLISLSWISSLLMYISCTVYMAMILYLWSYSTVSVLFRAEAGVRFDSSVTCTYGHIPTPSPILGACPLGGPILLHSVSRLALEGDILANCEVLSVAKAISWHTWIPAVYHYRERLDKIGVEEMEQRLRCCSHTVA